MGFCYESTVMTASSKIENSLRKGVLQLYFDVPKCSYQALLPNQQRLHLSVLVPAGSKACYIAFAKGHQIWESKGDKKNISGRCRFPTSLRKCIFTIAGHETIGSRGGYEGLGSNLGFSSESCRAYFADLRSQGIIDHGLEEFFPRDPDKSSFIQIFFMDLRPYRITKNTTMFVELEFSSNLSPVKTYLVSIFMREMAIFKSRGLWNTKFTDGGD